MSKSFFIDTTLCTACRGCQVACKQWHGLPAEETANFGSFQNPKDLSFNTYKLVRMQETLIDNKVQWLFFPDQCRHCIDAPCYETAMDESAIYKDEATGAIIYTANTKNLLANEIIESCPYNIPRAAPDGTLAKCDMCHDRVTNGLLPACVKTCPTGTMNFGDREAMLERAETHLAEAKKKFPQATLLDADDLNVIYLTGYDPQLYHEFAIASVSPRSMTRLAAMRKMLRPIVRMRPRLG
jgi:formate dehydrogenase iron-sulfur subunit